MVVLATSGFIEEFIADVNNLITKHLAGEITLEDLYTGVDDLLDQYGDDIDGMNIALGEQADVIEKIRDRFGGVADESARARGGIEQDLASLEQWNSILEEAVANGQTLADAQATLADTRLREELTEAGLTPEEIQDYICLLYTSPSPRDS